MSKRKKGSWIVRVKATVTKELVVSGCTEEQARSDPYSYEVEDEHEVDTDGYEVVDVTPNE